MNISFCFDEDVVAVGVSGGADSLALVLMLKEVLQAKVIALSVNHGLRPSAEDEIEYVKEIMDKHCIEHHCLVWEGEKPKTGIEEAARQARYSLLKKWCDDNNVKTLAVAHHLKDQAETFFMRLERGSGLDGLCGMSEFSYWKDLRIWRPCLKINPDVFKQYLKDKNIKWIEDESNYSDDFLRVRARNFLPILEEKLGISLDRIASTMEVLSLSKDFIQSCVNNFVKNNVKNWNDCGYSMNLNNFEQQHNEIKFKILANLIRDCGKLVYAPEASDINRLVSKISDDKFKAATLGKCEIIKFDNKIWVVPELKIKEKISKKLWEDFVINFPKYKKMKIPFKMRLSLLKIKPIYK